MLIDVSGDTPGVRFYARPVVFEFVYGVCAYYVFVAAERRVGQYAERVGIRRGLWLVSLGAAFLIGLEESHGGFGVSRFIAAGMPAFALVLAALLLERVYGVNTDSRIVFLVGESSYILYLIHPHVIYGLLRTTRPTEHNLPLPAMIALVIALLLVSTGAAVAIHLWFEKPVMAGLRRRLIAAVEAAPGADPALAGRVWERGVNRISVGRPSFLVAHRDWPIRPPE